MEVQGLNLSLQSQSQFSVAHCLLRLPTVCYSGRVPRASGRALRYIFFGLPALHSANPKKDAAVIAHAVPRPNQKSQSA